MTAAASASQLAVGVSQRSARKIELPIGSEAVISRESEEQRRILGDNWKQYLHQQFKAERSASAGVMKSDFHQELYGVNELKFPEELWNDLAKEWSFSLVGMIFDACPSLGRISTFVRSRWGNEKFVSIAQINSGVFIFSFKSLEDMNRILDEGPWYFDNKPIVMKPWVAGEVYSLEDVKSLPLWVRFPRLPVHLHRVDALSRIASVLGKPLRTNGFTSGKSNLMYVRVLVEVYASMELKHSITIKGPNGISIVQKVEYSWIPNRCENCHCFGHKGVDCELPRVAMNKEEKEVDRVVTEPLKKAKEVDRVVVDPLKKAEEVDRVVVEPLKKAKEVDRFFVEPLKKAEEVDRVVVEPLKKAEEVNEVAKDKMEGFPDPSNLVVNECLISAVPETECLIATEVKGDVGEVSSRMRMTVPKAKVPFTGGKKKMKGKGKGKKKKIAQGRGVGAKLTLLKW